MEKIQQQPIDLWEKVTALYRLLNLLYVELTKAERLQFTTLFARIAYVGHKYELPKALQFQVHAFRTHARRRLNKGSLPGKKADQVYQQGLYAVGQSIARLLQAEWPKHLQVAAPTFDRPLAEVQAFHARLRVVALQDDAANDQLIVRSEEQPEEVQRVQYN
ncbi:MAG: hypothetical protein AAFV25_20520, partial [Bacteroidota bacterium]